MNKFREMLGRALLGRDSFEKLAKLNAQEILHRLDDLNGILLGGRTNSGATVNEDTAMRYAAVYTAVRIISEVFAMFPCNLMRKDANGGVEPAFDHPTHEVLYRIPNSWQTAFEFWRYVMVCLLLRGNFYGWINRDGNMRCREIVPIHPDRIKIEVDDDLTLIYKYTPKGGRERVMERGEIFHIRAVGSNHYVGSPPIQQARESIGIGMQAEVHAAKMFVNGARIGMVLKHPEIVSDEVAERIKESFEKAYAGIENSHKTVLLEEGVTVEKIGMTAEDAQFIEQRKFQRSEVLAIFGVPPHMAGDTEKTTSWGSGIEQQTIGFVTFVMMPHAVNVEQAIYRDVLTLKERKEYYAKFNSDAIIRGDLLSRYKAHQIGIDAGFLNRNEVRAMENRNPAPGLDKFMDPTAAPKPKPGEDKPNDPATDEGDKP